MTDYTQNVFFTPKDALPASDPDKLILGFDLDGELLEIQTTQATKFDSSDIASQAQAEAGISNSVLMTPLRVSNLLAGTGSGAGIVNDLIALTDPGDDRILFWDESIDSAAYLDIGTHLETTAGAVLNVTEGTINHDALLNFVSDEHIDHSTVVPTAGIGIAVTGSDITASFTFSLDINGLAEELTLDTAVDTVAFYDDSAGLERKVPLESFIGTSLGDGKWFKSTSTVLADSVEITIAYNTEDYDALERGTFSIVTGEYTVGASDTRIQITAYASATAPENTALELRIQVNGVLQAQSSDILTAGAGTSGSDVIISTNLNLSSGDVVRVRAFTGAGASGPATPIIAGIANNAVSIVELG